MPAATPRPVRPLPRRWLSGLAWGALLLSARADGPPAPGAVQAQSGGDREVTLSWTASPGATSYTIFRSNTQNDTGIKQVAENVAATTYHATGLHNDLTYYFRVKAVGPAGMSAFSAEAAATTLITRQALPEGVYTLAPRSAPQLRLSAGAQGAELVPRSAAAAQRWQLKAVNLTTYVLVPLSEPDRSLAVGDAPPAGQQWMLVAGPKGFRLAPAEAPGLALSAADAATGGAVTRAASDGSAAQTWIVLPLPEGGPDGMPDPGTKFVPEGYQLVFGDEFGGDQVDLAKWETLAPYSQPHLNKELENYLPEAVTVKDGVCVLTAEAHESTCSLAGKQPAPHCGGVHHWRSGAITSRPTFRHGYYEARLKLPQGVGMWPAFWATSATRWPPEWDFLEVQNTIGTLYQYMHPTKGAKLTWVRGAIGRDSVYTTGKGMPNPYDGYVVYGAEVTPKGVKLWINGVLTAEWEVSADTIDPMWVNCELAVGDNWAGVPDSTTPEKNHMFIDYVRVYQSPAVEAEVQRMLAGQAKPEPKKS